MKVTVITVCFNSADTIEDTIRSVVSQNYSDIEYIVVDGGSTDMTNDIVRKYSDFISVHLSQKDEGIYDAMNKGIGLATGDIVGVLNSDDVFASSDSITSLVEGFVDESVDAVYADLIYVQKNDMSKMTRLYSSGVFNKARIKFGIMLPHPTFYARKSVLDVLGKYKLNYRVAADFEYITRFISKGFKARRVPKVVVKMREGGVSSNGLAWRVHQNFEIVRACRENGIRTSILLVMLKLPYKLFTMTSRWSSSLSS